ncbi:hypothetical protein [Pseudoalteromonas luteoviolacea]|uniref:hypothetical protein n=1 Tax=Pseudoalteromonas luteoviolacea TaxID=43657 RepID=UPI001B3655E7|nr:hypothetical protein [Pseudoalteromonas luteoviolacea]MBQ4838782.1 hypothetical protein [Pseudoalteromonas luteoviolacea]
MAYLFLIVCSFAGALFCRRVSNNKHMRIESYVSSTNPGFYQQLSSDRFDIDRQAAFVKNLAAVSSLGELTKLEEVTLRELLYDRFLADMGVIFFSLGTVIFSTLIVFVI